MNNFEKIKQMSKEDLAKFLCGLMSADDCEVTCPAREHCRFQHNGLIDWLEREVEE